MSFIRRISTRLIHLVNAATCLKLIETHFRTDMVTHPFRPIREYRLLYRKWITSNIAKARNRYIDPLRQFFVRAESKRDQKAISS